MLRMLANSMQRTADCSGAPAATAKQLPLLPPPGHPAAAIAAGLQVCRVRATMAPEAAAESGSFAAEFTKEIVDEEKK